MTSAGNQQERLTVDVVPISLGYFLSGFALGESSFMLVCRKRGDYARKWKISAAFNVSQQDREPLDVFRSVLGCGTMRKAGNGGWYFEVNRLEDICTIVIPFFRRFPLVGTKARDFELFAEASRLLRGGDVSDSDYVTILGLREQMNRGGKRKYTTARILRDYTPGPSGEHETLVLKG